MKPDPPSSNALWRAGGRAQTSNFSPRRGVFKRDKRDKRDKSMFAGFFAFWKRDK